MPCPIPAAPVPPLPGQGHRWLAHWFRAVLVLALWMAGLAWAPARADGLPEATMATAATAPTATIATTPPQPLRLNRRVIAELRATVLGDSPADRIALAEAALHKLLATDGPGRVSITQVGEALRIEADGQTLFYLVAADLAGPRPELRLQAAGAQVQRELELALREAREMRDGRLIAVGAAWSLGATLLAVLLLRGLLLLRQRGMDRLEQRLQAWAQQRRGSVLESLASPGRAGLGLASVLLTWLLGLMLAEAWLSFVLHQFAYTRPWGERAGAWLLNLLQQFGLALAGALPGLLTAVLIFGLARLASRGLALLLLRVERGETRLHWMDADTAAPTRRVASVLIWLFALVMAYPYLPGAGSEAFKGVSVLAGVMLSLGASSVVGQALSGLSLMYARALRVGEYVRIGDTEGTVSAVGLLATKIHTGMGEEVSLPSAMIVGQPVRNFSRLVQDGQFMLQTGVTIGYATPWRQVHALLLEAARRTAGVARDPAPYVVQTALSDFYVEYKLCAQGNRAAPQRRVEALNALHGHIQDLFNEHGVQIMSPHYRSDPAEPQVVPRERWYAPPARPPVADDAPDAQAPR